MNSPDSDPPPVADLNFFFRLAVVAAAVFIITILALVAALFGNQQAPAAKLINAYGGVLIAGEVAVVLLVAFLAMALDRIRTLRNSPADRDTITQESDTSATAPSLEDPLS